MFREDYVDMVLTLATSLLFLSKKNPSGFEHKKIKYTFSKKRDETLYHSFFSDNCEVEVVQNMGNFFVMAFTPCF